MPGRFFSGVVVAALVMLGGCASTIRLDHDVRSYAAWPSGELPKAGDTFRFERLPSQQPSATEPSALERLVEPVLVNVGLRPTAGTEPPRWKVEISARGMQLPQSPWYDPRDRWPGWGLAGRDYVVTSKGQMVGMPMLRFPPTPYYQREVLLLMRDAASGQVVYETRAAHDGPWSDNPALWTALFQAAMEGFPQPPSGPRKVYINLPR